MLFELRQNSAKRKERMKKGEWNGKWGGEWGVGSGSVSEKWGGGKWGEAGGGGESGVVVERGNIEEVGSGGKLESSREGVETQKNNPCIPILLKKNRDRLERKDKRGLSEKEREKERKRLNRGTETDI